MRPLMLLLSIALAVLPLAGIAWIFAAGALLSVDGLFMSLILLTLSGIFFLNVFLECRDCGFLGKKATPAKATSPAKVD